MSNFTINYDLFTKNEHFETLADFLKSISTTDCFLVDENSIKCKTLKSTTALFKAYAKKQYLCVRFDKSQCNFAKQYLAEYISVDNSESKTDAFIRCFVKYDDFESFFKRVCECVAIDNAKHTSEAEQKQTSAKQKQKQTVTKQK